MKYDMARDDARSGARITQVWIDISTGEDAQNEIERMPIFMDVSEVEALIEDIKHLLKSYSG